MSATTPAVDESSASEGSSSAHDAGAGGSRHLGLALLVISAAQLMVVLDATIVNIALPHLRTDLGFSFANLPWVVNAYTLAFGGLLLLGGRAGDLLGRRRVFMVGVVLFAVASLLGGLAQNDTWMLFARVLQGCGAAIASPTALSLVTTNFPPGAARNRAFAVYAAMSGAGAAVGLILGGVLTEASWRWTFIINVPIGLFVACVAPRVLNESSRQQGRFDLPGALTATAGLSLVVYGFTHAADRSAGWGDPVTIGTLAVGVALVIAFLGIEARSTHALMPFRVLADRTRAVSYVAMLVIGAGLFAMFYFLGIYIQTVLGYSAVKAGFAFLPFSVGIVVAAQVASRLVSRVDPRWIAGLGAAVAAVGMWLYTHITTSSSYLGGVLPGMLVISLGMGLVFVPMTLTAVHGVERRDSGVASAVLNTMQQVGSAVGLAVLSTVATTAATSRASELTAQVKQQAASGQLSGDKAKAAAQAVAAQAEVHGFTAAFLVGAVLILGAAVVAVVGLSVRHTELATDGAAPGAAI
ncbi:MAG: DHA2 family efflux MFS transporter permease subunit [Actinomycetes bacterium]